MAIPVPFGAFGKIPALGDFFRFDLAADFIAAWDTWLQQGIQTARADLGEGWLQAYMSAPIWRFTLAPGLAGRSAVQGVLMGSVDRVGRQFPLTLARALPEGSDPVAAHLAAEACFAALEGVALSALEDGFGQDQLRLGLAAIVPQAPPPPLSASIAPGFLRLRSPDPAAALATALSRPAFPRAAIFSALLPGEDALFLCAGLPQPERFRHLIVPPAEAV